MTIEPFKCDFMEAIREATGKEMMNKAKLPKFFICGGKSYDIPMGWNAIHDGKIRKGDRAFIGGGDVNRFLTEKETANLVGSSAKGRICIIRKMTKEQIEQVIEEAIETKIIRMNKDEFLKIIKTFLEE